MNILTALANIAAVRPHIAEDYIATVQAICAEALAFPELTAKEAAKFLRAIPSESRAEASRNNGRKNKSKESK